MKRKTKKHLTLNIDSEIAQKAVADPDINVSELTERVLRVFTAPSENVDKEKTYKVYQELFNIMLPLLQKFKVDTIIAREVFYDAPEMIGEDESGNTIYSDPIPSEWFNIHLQPDGKLYLDGKGEIKIKEIDIGEFLKRQAIIDEFLNSIQGGVNYRKDQFKEIEMAKTIIDAITKGVIPKSKGKGRKK